MNERFPFDQSESIDVEYRVNGESPKTTSVPEKKAPNPRLNIILFIATFFTTTFAGAFMTELDPTSSLWLQLHKGLPFSLTLLTILLFHEFGHYFMAKKHRVEASLPYPNAPILARAVKTLSMSVASLSMRTNTDRWSPGL